MSCIFYGILHFHDFTQQTQDFHFQNRERKGGNYIAPPTHNSEIFITIRLASGLQYFWGAFVHDLMVKYNLSNVEGKKSVWFIVDAVNRKDEFYWRTTNFKIVLIVLIAYSFGMKSHQRMKKDSWIDQENYYEEGNMSLDWLTGHFHDMDEFWTFLYIRGKSH